MMRSYPFIIVSLLVSFVIRINAEEKLSFARSFRAGDLYDLEITLQEKKEYSFFVPSSASPVIKNEIFQAVLNGKYEILRTDGNGNPEKFRLEITMAGASFGEKSDLPSSLLTGKVFLGNISASETSFLLENGEKPDARVREFLARIFRPQMPNEMRNTFGPPRIPKIGEHWKINSENLLRAFAQRGFDIKKNEVKTSAMIRAKKFFKGYEVYEIGLAAEASLPPGLDFRFSSRLLLPVREELPVLKLERSGKEVFYKRLFSADPVASGTTIRVISTEKSEFQMLPAKELKKSWSDFILR